jgi:DNA polymerase-1
LAASLFYGKLYTDHIAACKHIASTDKEFKRKWHKLLPELGIEGAVQAMWPKAKKIFRSAAKNAQFALAYGARLPKIAETLMMSIEMASPGYYAYCKRFPKIAGFTNNMKSQIQTKGFVVTSFGRKLYVRKDKPYSASNYIIQGTAAGILKRAQIRVSEYLKDMDIHVLLPIHDELIIEYPRSLLPQASIILPEIERLMTDMSEIQVPLAVEWKMTTYTWDRAKEFKYAQTE